jgi:hypothetical protein
VSDRHAGYLTRSIKAWLSILGLLTIRGDTGFASKLRSVIRESTSRRSCPLCELWIKITVSSSKPEEPDGGLA